MPILSYYFNNLGKAGVEPQFVNINTNDSLATVTTTGYLNGIFRQQEPISENMAALVTILRTNTPISGEKFETYTFRIIKDGSNYSLTSAVVPGSVIASSLDPLILPVRIIKFADLVQTTAGSTTQLFNIPGALNTDIAFAQVFQAGVPTQILEAFANTNNLTVIFSADPGSSTVVAYQIIRAI